MDPFLKKQMDRAMDNDVVSQFIIAEQYADGFGVEQDLAVAVSWYRKAAENGYALAQLALARCLSKGLGVAPDQGEALEWFRKAADQGNSEGLAELGCHYAFGENWEEAVKWFIKASERGENTSLYNLGVCYSEGLGVPKDQSEAYAYFCLYGEKSRSGKEMRDRLENSMSPEAILLGKQRAKVLKDVIDACSNQR
jgi:TPR repeat protein